MPSSKGSSQTGDQTQVPCIVGEFFTVWDTREAHLISYSVSKLQYAIFSACYIKSAS